MKNTGILIVFVCNLFISNALYAQGYNHDYSQTWTSKMFLSKPNQHGGSEVNLTFEQALELIRQTDHLTLEVPKIIYLVGWQYNGHDDGYPAFFEVNPALKRSADASAAESLQWLMREAKKYHTTVSLHINMTDAYDNSPLWNEYVENDLIAKDESGRLKIIGEYNGCKAYQINYKNEWNTGYTPMRIDRLLQLLPELKKAGTIHVDAWIARPSEGHHETVVMEAEYQKKALFYWNAKGIDVTSEWVMDYMTGYVPLAWHFNAFSQQDYLTVPACVYTGVGINPDISGSDQDLGFLFGTSSYGEPFWQRNKGDRWIPELTKDFMLKCPQYFYLNLLKRISVEGKGKNRVAVFSGNVQVSLADSLITQGSRVMRRNNTIAFPAVWRNDSGMIVYTADTDGKLKLDIPPDWRGTEYAALYAITTSGLQLISKLKVKHSQLEMAIKTGDPYYVIPYK